MTMNPLPAAAVWKLFAAEGGGTKVTSHLVTSPGQSPVRHFFLFFLEQLPPVGLGYTSEEIAGFCKYMKAK